MRRVTGLVVTGLCVCGSAFAQSGNPLVVPGPRSAAHASDYLTDPHLTRGPDHAAFGEDFAPSTAAAGSQDRTATMLRNRLAALGRLRAAATDSGDAELLQQAERLESEARRQLAAHPATDAPSPMSRPSHRTAAYEYDPSASPQVITPASGHPIDGFRHDSSAARSSNTGEFGLPATVSVGSGERSFDETDDADARFYSRRRNASELPRSNDERSETWYGAAPRGLDAQRRAADPRAADPGIEEPFAQPSSPASPARSAPAAPPASSGIRTGSREFGSDPADDSPFAPQTRSRHVEAGMHQDETPFAMPRSSAWDRPSAGTPAASAPEANPFAQSAFDSRSRAASPFADQPELSPGRSTARSAEPARRSAPPFDTRTPGDAAASSNPFRAHPAAGPPVSRRDVGLPSATPTRRSAGLVYGSERESEAPSRRLELPRSSDSPLYYGRDLGQATTAEGRAAGRDVGLTPASGTRSRIPVETGPGGGDPFGEPPGTSISGALDMPAGTRGDEPAPSQAGESKPEKPKRGLFSWFRKRGQSEK